MTFYGGTASNLLPYDVLTAIPARMLLTRNPEQTAEEDARLVHNAFLLAFQVAMPCLQPKQIREACIHGAANVFKGPLDQWDFITTPEWATEELRCDPAADFGRSASAVRRGRDRRSTSFSRKLWYR